MSEFGVSRRKKGPIPTVCRPFFQGFSYEEVDREIRVLIRDGEGLVHNSEDASHIYFNGFYGRPNESTRSGVEPPPLTSHRLIGNTLTLSPVEVLYLFHKLKCIVPIDEKECQVRHKDISMISYAREWTPLL
jgi:hypothetical protein